MFHLATQAVRMDAKQPAKAHDAAALLTLPGLRLSRGAGPLTPYSWPSTSTDSEDLAKNYPNTWLFASAPHGRQLCVATAVGPRTVITAGHCIDPAKTYKLLQNNSSLTARCVKPPDGETGEECDKTKRAKDVAVCTLDPPDQPDLFLAPGGRYESIDTKTPAAAGAVVLVTFTACTGGTPRDVVAPISLQVDSWPSPSVQSVALAGKSTAICPRDSGGPWMGATSPRVVALHVCHEGSSSWGVALDQESVQEFLRQQESGGKAPLCGLSASAAMCR